MEASIVDENKKNPQNGPQISKQNSPLCREFENIFHLFQSSLFDKDLSFSSQASSGREKIIQKIVKENSSSQNQKRILSEFTGFGPLDSLICDEEINEIMINGKDHIFYEKHGRIQPLEDSFLSSVTFHNVVEKIGSQAQITVNFKKPFNEGKWGPFRIHILCPPIVKGDFHLCLRRPAANPWTFERLEKQNWAPSSAIEIVRRFVRGRLNFLIVGAASSGKTSVLNACLQEAPPNERILSIEDADEIVLPNKTGIKLLTQTNPSEPKALIGQESLLRQSLRLRPDRIVMGEVRGGESKDLLLALASGHRGSLGTLHGNDHKQALWKLETLTQMGAPQWQSSTVQKLIFSSLDGLLVLEKKEGLRRLKGIYKIAALEPSGFLFDPLYERNAD